MGQTCCPDPNYNNPYGGAYGTQGAYGQGAYGAGAGGFGQGAYGQTVGVPGYAAPGTLGGAGNVYGAGYRGF
jgi:hypothetical protein